MNTTIMFAKTNPEAIIPSKRVEDAGFDIYPCFKEDYMILQPHATTLVPTGIASVCDPSYCFILKERGSTGTKGIAQRCGVIDSGYRAEWFVPLSNNNDFPVIILKSGKDVYDKVRGVRYLVYPYEKAIAQALVVPVPEVEVCEVPMEYLQSVPSERGNGALGSSGK